MHAPGSTTRGAVCVTAVCPTSRTISSASAVDAEAEQRDRERHQRRPAQLRQRQQRAVGLAESQLRPKGIHRTARSTSAIPPRPTDAANQIGQPGSRLTATAATPNSPGNTACRRGQRQPRQRCRPVRRSTAAAACRTPGRTGSRSRTRRERCRFAQQHPGQHRERDDRAVPPAERREAHAQQHARGDRHAHPGSRRGCQRPSRATFVSVAASAMDDHTAVHGLQAARQRIGRRPAAAAPAPATSGRWTSAAPRRRRAHVQRPGVPHRVGRGRTGHQRPGDAVAHPAARQPPRVAAANAARTETALPGVRWCVAARTVAHGFMLVTGVSEPKARGTPDDANSASGLSPAPSHGAQSTGVHAVVAAPQRVEVRLHAGDDAPRAQPAGLLVADHLEVFEAVSAPGDRRRRHIGRRRAANASTTAVTAASPITWKPAAMPASVQASRWAVIASGSR